MKKLFKYPFLCLLVLTAVLAMPFAWQEIGVLPEGILPTFRCRVTRPRSFSPNRRRLR